MTAPFHIPSIADLEGALRSSVDLTAKAKQIVDAVSDLYENEDAQARRKAVAALEQDRPAYWTTASYHSQRACQLQVRAHETSLPNALRSTYHSADWVAALDRLVPLNEQAAIAVAVQYEEMGTFRDIDELLARRLRKPVREEA
jgi:hypothetical protein